MITLNNSNINFDSEDTSDESKYTISLSHKTSNFIFKTAGIERLKIMNNGNIFVNNGNLGIGEFNTLQPLSKLHICDNNPKLIIQDTRIVTYGDINATRVDRIPQILPIDIGIDKIEKYIKFTYLGNDLGDGKRITLYYFTTTTDLEVDILIVGGGGAGGDAYGGGGGAGGVVYIKNYILLAGSYRVHVGGGGIGLSSGLNDPGLSGGSIFTDQHGADSEIKKAGEDASLTVNGINGINDIKLLGKGGGTGGTLSASDARDTTTGSSEIGRNGGSGGGASGSASIIETDYAHHVAGKLMQGKETVTDTTIVNTFWNGSSFVQGGNDGRQNPSKTDKIVNFVVGGGGGGIGSESNNSTCGNNGVVIDITGEAQIYAAGGGAGIHVEDGTTISSNLGLYGLGGSSGIGGNGRIYNGTNYIRSATSGKEDTGSGGGGSAYQVVSKPLEDAGSGGSGVVIIRYRPLINTSASIELIRNTNFSNDNNTDYKIGNFDGNFKIKSSTTNTDINRLVIDKNGDITISKSINASNYLLNGQPFSILEEAKNSSNYIATTSNLLIEYINRTNQQNTSSQWTDNGEINDKKAIYYNGGKVGIGITNPTDNFHIYNNSSNETNLTIQSDVDLLNYNTNMLPPELNIVNGADGLEGSVLNSGTDFLVHYTGTSVLARNYDRLYHGYAFKYEPGTSSDNPIQYYVINTTEEYIVDIFIIGAGGAATVNTADGVGGAGGAGGVVYIVDKKLDAGKYYITVGKSTLSKGEDSSIKYYRNGTVGEIVTIDGIKLLGKGGGKGRTSGDSYTNGTNIGSGGGGFYGITDKNKGITQDQGNTYWNVNTNTYTSGGFDGKDAVATGGGGGGFNNGNGTTINLIPNYHSHGFGKGGIVYTVSTAQNLLHGIDSTGNGGSRDNSKYGLGGSGYVFIRYRKIPQSKSSINLSIGNTKQLSYSISNTNNIFKINSGISDVLVINTDGNANFKGNLTAKSYIIEGGNNILKDTSNYIASTSNILTNFILTTSNLITNFINNKKSSQWNDRLSSTDIYYDGNVGIGVTVGVGVYNPGPVSKLTINDFISSFNHSIAPLTITNRIAPIITDPIDVLHLCRVGGVDTYNTGMRATFRLGKYDAVASSAKTRLEIGLSDGAYNTSNIVMSILSNGKVGIGTTNPTTELHVPGTITAGTISATSISLTGAGTLTGNINVNNATEGTLSIARGGTGSSDTDLIEDRILFTGLKGGTGADSTKKIIKSTDLFYYSNGTVSKLGVGTTPDINSSKLNINKNISEPNTFDYSKSPLTITNEKNVNNADSITPTDVLHLCRAATALNIQAIRATFKLSKWSIDDDSKSNTRLDLELADSSYNITKKVITFLSSGKIGIGSINSPENNLFNSININSSILNINNNIIDGVNNSFDYSEAPLTITNQIITTIEEPNDLKDVLHLCRVGYTAGTEFGPTGARASFRLGMGDQNNGNSNTRLDIALARGVYKDPSITIMTILSSGNVGIGITNPAVALDIVGSIKASNNLEISGNVGIGKTPNATYKLDVNGNINMPTGGILSAGGFAYVPALAATATSIASTSTSIIPVTNGGTGASSITSGRLLYASSATAIGSTNLFWNSSKLAIGTDTLNTDCSTLTINSIITDASFNHSVAPMTITNNQTGLTAINVTSDVLHLCRIGGTNAFNTGMRATFKLGKYADQANNSKTRLDIALAEAAYNTDVNVMTIISSGKVGIGTTTPNQPLHVQTALRIGGSAPILEFGDDSTTQIIRNGTGVESELRFKTSSIDRVTIDINGKVGIGIANPSQKLHVVGEIYSTGEITAFFSDERLKTKISTINNPLSIVNKLNGFYYIPNEIATKYGINKNKIEIGLSAQDVQKVLPELVKLAPFDADTNEAGEIISKSGEKYLTISYERIVPVLVEAIKELEVKNNCLNEKYENILQEISLINKKINLI